MVAVSPIVAGRAIKGPAAEMLQALGLSASPVGVADYYRGLLHMLVLDRADEGLAGEVRARGLQAHVCDTMMVSAPARLRLAREVLAAARRHPAFALG